MASKEITRVALTLEKKGIAMLRQENDSAHSVLFISIRVFSHSLSRRETRHAFQWRDGPLVNSQLFTHRLQFLGRPSVSIFLKINVKWQHWQISPSEARVFKVDRISRYSNSLHKVLGYQGDHGLVLAIKRGKGE